MIKLRWVRRRRTGAEKEDCEVVDVVWLFQGEDKVGIISVLSDWGYMAVEMTGRED